MHTLEKEFPFEMTQMQREAAMCLSDFILSPNGKGAFVLKGYAGTGKTTLLGALVRTLGKLHRNTVLMAPTGRAAKVFSLHAGHPAFTIHKIIYRQRKKEDLQAGFCLNVNRDRNTLFIVDEASMISNAGSMRPFFGSGMLLDDLLQFVYNNKGCQILFVGDTAQLPPVGEELSPALSPDTLASLGLCVYHFTLDEVMRQSNESGILSNATVLRQTMDRQDYSLAPTIHFDPFKDVVDLPGGELINALEDSYDNAGLAQTIVITRSNKNANLYNNGIRKTIFGREEGLAKGDTVMIAKNNYFWTERLQANLPAGETLPMDFIANGDIAIVKSIRKFIDLYDFHFADVSLSFPDFNDMEMDVKVLLDTLSCDAPALPEDLSNKLYMNVMEDYADFSSRKKKMDKIRENPYFHALQIKYAYAVTCHKAQGGQWEHVFIDQGWLPPDGIDTNYFHWLYTAFTRATKYLYLINWPQKQKAE